MTPGRTLNVHLLPALVAPADLAGGVVVMIDNLRASVTITAALSAGAERVIAAATVEEALAVRDRLRVTAPTDRVLLGGERAGVLIPGFDLDNSPDHYTSERVTGRTIIFTTTNGTLALRHAEHAAELLVGSFTNLSAVCARVADDLRPVHILCAGTNGRVSLDDCLPAGAMTERLIGRTRDDAACLCLRAWQAARSDLVRAMAESRGGKGLAHLGFTRDIERCSTIDLFPVVPRVTGQEIRTG